jgi:hypothetical protein
MKNEKPKEKKYDRTCIFVGRRLGKGNKTYQVFLLLPEKTEMYFRGIKRVYLGFTYRCTKNAIPIKPEMVHGAERVDNPEWEARDALVDEHNALRRSEAKYRKQSNPRVQALIASLKPLVKDLAFYETRNLIEYLVTKSKGK